MPRLCNLLEAWMLLILGTVLLIPAPELPSVNGKSCLYGTFLQDGRRVFLTDQNWIAAGSWNEDGTLDLMWSQHGCMPCFGTYRLEGKRLVGRFTYVGDGHEHDDAFFLE